MTTTMISDENNQNSINKIQKPPTIHGNRSSSKEVTKKPPQSAEKSATTTNTALAKTIHTDNDRMIEYSVNGSEREDAHVFVMAYVSEHLAWPPPWYETYEFMNIKSITISLPGLGNSSPHPGYKISDWPITDLKPILEAENVKEFVMWGVSYGCLHAMAVAQRYGPDRVLALGLRAPYLPLSVSKANNLPKGQDEFPTTQDLLNESFTSTIYRFLIENVMNPMIDFEEGGWMQYFMEQGLLGSALQPLPKFAKDFPKEMTFLKSLWGAITTEGLLYMMAKDVALDCPGLDVPSIKIPGKSMVVWYADDDCDCPPSHGRWVENHFEARWTRTLTGYGHYSASFVDMDVFFNRLIQSIAPRD